MTLIKIGSCRKDLPFTPARPDPGYTAEQQARIREEGEKRRKEKLESNSEYQRRKAMSKEDKHRDAKDKVTRNMFEHFQRTGQSRKSYADAERVVEKIVQKSIRENE